MRTRDVSNYLILVIGLYFYSSLSPPPHPFFFIPVDADVSCRSASSGPFTFAAVCSAQLVAQSYWRGWGAVEVDHSADPSTFAY